MTEDKCKICTNNLSNENEHVACNKIIGGYMCKDCIKEVEGKGVAINNMFALSKIFLRLEKLEQKES